VELDAMFIWSTIHGLVGVMGGSCIDKLNLSPQVMDHMMEHVIQRVSAGLGLPPTTAPG
jgi:hypothetical protein